jgi:hypothetical protein
MIDVEENDDDMPPEERELDNMRKFICSFYYLIYCSLIRFFLYSRGRNVWRER